MRLGSCRVDEARKIVTVTEIIDANRFRATWRGQHYEARVLPDTTYLTANSDVVCHVLPGTSELVAVFKPKVAGILYFSPGQNLSGDFQAELWSWNGTVATLVWTCPISYSYITCLAWNSTTKTLFIWVCDGDVKDYVYEYSPVTGTTTQRVDAYCALDGEDEYTGPAVQVAELDGKYYVSHGGATNDHFVFEFDPTTYTNTQKGLYSGGVASYGSGGIAAIGSTLVWHVSGGFYVSTDNGDSWTLGEDLRDYMVGLTYGPSGAGAVYDPATDQVYLGAYRMTDPGGHIWNQIWRYDGATFALDWESAELADTDQKPHAFAIGYPVGGTTPNGLYCGQWSWWSDDEADILERSGGAWAVGESFDPKYALPAGRSLTSYRGKLHLLANWVDESTSTAMMDLVRRDSAGSWTVLQTFSGYEPYPTYEYVVGMAVSGRNIAPHAY